MLPCCWILLTDFRTVLVFAQFFSVFMGITMGKQPKITNMGRKGPRAKTKTVLKSVSKMQQLGSMPNLRFSTLSKLEYP